MNISFQIFWIIIDSPVRSALVQNKLGLFAAILFIFQVVPYGLAVRIPGFHPGGPGSTPGMGKGNFFRIKCHDRLFS